jgi:outer membrane protein assembly factor BamB
LRTPRWLALCALAIPAMASIPAAAAPATDAISPWPQYQGNAQRSGVAPIGAPEPPYAIAWHAAAGIGDPTQVSGIPAPILTDRLAIVVGRETVDAFDVATGEQVWSVPRALGPASPAAIDGNLLLFVEGGGDESASANASSAPPATTTAPSTATAGANPSASMPAPTDTASSLVAVSLRSQERRWTVPLSDVSHTGVLIDAGTAVVGTDDGTVTAVDLGGRQLWSQDVGDHVLTPMAGSAGLLYVSVLPEQRAGSAALVALQLRDGTQAWRYEPAVPTPGLGVPSIGSDDLGGDTIYVVDRSSVRAIGPDGTQRWAAPTYSLTTGSPPAVGNDAVFVTDQTGTVYAFDRGTGSERWRFATNRTPGGSPIVTRTAVLQPAVDGTVSAISIDAGHQIWHASISDNAVLGLAATTSILVATSTGTTPGIAGLVADQGGTIEDIVSPTTGDPRGLLLGWLAAAVPIAIVLLLLGRRVAVAPDPTLLGSIEDDAIDPWEDDLEGGP